MVLFQFLWQQILQAEESMSMASRTSSTTIYRTNLKVTFTVLEERHVQDAAVLHTLSVTIQKADIWLAFSN